MLLLRWNNSAEEDWKAIRWEVVAHVMALKALEGEVVYAGEVLWIPPTDYTGRVRGLDQVMDQERRFYPTASIPVEERNPFQVTSEATP